MTEMEDAWLAAYLETGDAEQALTEAGSQCQGESRRVRAHQLKRKLAEEIDKGLRERFGTEAPVFAGVVSKLATQAKSEDVQLKAARDMLDRGGYKAPERHEHTLRLEGEIVTEIRALVATMDPKTLRDAGLYEALQDLGPAGVLEPAGNDGETA